MDGTTDAGNIEDKLVAIVWCSKDVTNQQMITLTCFLSLHNPKTADASGLLNCVGEAIKLLGVEDLLSKDSVLSVVGKPVLVGIGKDDAMVNIGEWDGMKGQL